MGARHPGILFLVLTLLLSAGTAVYGQTPDATSQAETEQVAPSPTPEAETEVETEGSETEATEETSEEAGGLGDAGSLDPPEPEVTPGIVSEVVTDLVEQTGLEDVLFLGLYAE